ncbi:hypothetical protein DYU11_18245 [Fibrisoma montanum]|uniref:Uncharacterized protein n=1 Tax=Fibrisoma montanum TaxID=2305895 RepID=A0A418M5Z6_9BACT|nr:hypothetical protein [Fibrisoma montanum]RIV21347.1 hypothetical protein DYU11_18245 [Fibrisoma montanum]
MSKTITVGTLDNVTCKVRFEVSVDAKPSDFQAYLQRKTPCFAHFASAFRLQAPEYHYFIGNEQADDLVGILPDELGKREFTLIVETQRLLTSDQAYQLAVAANSFTKYWEETGVARNRRLLVEADGIPVQLD